LRIWDFWSTGRRLEKGSTSLVFPGKTKCREVQTKSGSFEKGTVPLQTTASGVGGYNKKGVGDQGGSVGRNIGKRKGPK